MRWILTDAVVNVDIAAVPSEPWGTGQLLGGGESPGLRRHRPSLALRTLKLGSGAVASHTVG